MRLKQAFDPRLMNEHCSAQIPVEDHDVKYLGEKLRCICGPMIGANSEARDALREALFGQEL